MNVEIFVSKQLELLELERSAEIEEVKCLHEGLSLKELQKKGVCIPKLHLASNHVGLFGRFINVFKPLWPGRPLPSHNIRSGDVVGIGHFTSDGKHQIIATGVVTQVEEVLVSVALENSCEELSVLESDTQYIIIKLPNDVTYKCLKRALKQLKQERSERISRLIDVLFGNSKPTCGRFIADSIFFFNKNLNESQQDAVKFALSQREVSLVHGPPGTGKTSTLAEIIMQAVTQNLKVLACAPSNVAVDNIVERLSNYKVKMIRLGHAARLLPGVHKFSLDAVISSKDESRVISDLCREIDEIKAKIEKTREHAIKRKLWAENRMNLKELKEREKTVITEVLKEADVILCTLTSATPSGPIKHLPKDYFDIVVVDECSQALEASCWISLLQAPRCVLAGDHHQLPPTIISKRASKDGLAETLMERLIKLYGNDIVKMLTVQYRMNEKIMKWSSEQLYDGKLEAHLSVNSHLLRDIVGVKDDENTAVPLLLIDTAGCDLDELDTEDEDSKGNEGEADLVYCHVEDLIRSGVDASDIAVITPYNLQVDLLKSRLFAKYPQLEIKSVDGFQGREKEAVILSLVRSNSTGEVGFLAEDRRINVAVTRAKRHLAVIANSETVSHHPFLKSFVDYIFAEGEVRSASQYEKEIGQFPKFQPQYVKPRKSTLDGNNNKTTNKMTHSQKKGCEENFSQQKILGKADNMDHSSSSANNVEFTSRAKRLEEFRTTLKLFAENSDVSVLKFSPSLNAFERRIVHEIAEDLGLLHISQGISSERYIEVKKVETCSDSEAVSVEKHCSGSDEQSNSASHINKGQHRAATDSSQSHENSFLECDTNSNVLADVSELHKSTHCEKVKQKKSKSRQANVTAMNTTKSRKSASSSTGTFPAVDFDALIEETIKSNNTCALNECKKSTAVLSQDCQFCKNRFCYSHFLPEIHGCGAAAKAQARLELKKNGTLDPGTRKSQKNSDTVKHAQLQHKLNKKLTELSNQRKTKAKSK